jgi:hypothetical protein
MPINGKDNAEELILNFNIIYKRKLGILRATDESETVKCKSINSKKQNIIKYNCSFNTSGEDIDKIQMNRNNIYFVGKNISISSITPLAIKNMNNLQDCSYENIFEKNLYILNNSELVQDNEIFNITGELKENELSYKNANLEFIILSEKEREERNENVDCSIYQLAQKNKNYRLMCTCNKEMIGEINDIAFSLMENDNLLILFKEKYHLDYTKEEQYQEPYIQSKISKKEGFSAGYIVLIVLGVVILLTAITIAIVLRNRKTKLVENNNESTLNNISVRSLSTSNRIN